MSIAARLGRITPSLSGRQRALLVLRAVAAGDEPDHLRRFDDERERQDFDRYMAYFYVANSEVARICDTLSFYADRLTESNTIALLREAGGLLETETGDVPDPKVVSNWRRPRSVNLPEFFLGVAEELRRDMLADVLLRCEEMRAVEMAWEQLSEEFDGPSLLLPVVRDHADETWAKLRGLIDRLGGPKKLPEPDAASREMVLDRVEQAFRQICLVEITRNAETQVPRFRDASRWQS